MISAWQGKATRGAPLRILDTIIRRAHWIYGIPKSMLEFVKIQFAKTNPKLRETGNTFWIMNAKERSDY